MLHKWLLKRIGPWWLGWLWLVMWKGVIFYFSSQSAPNIPGADIYLIRKLGHVSEFLLLFILWVRAIRHTWAIKLQPALGLALLGTVVYAISDELHQRFVAGRDGNGLDVLIDAFVPALIWLWYGRKIEPQ